MWIKNKSKIQLLFSLDQVLLTRRISHHNEFLIFQLLFYKIRYCVNIKMANRPIRDVSFKTSFLFLTDIRDIFSWGELEGKNSVTITFSSIIDMSQMVFSFTDYTCKYNFILLVTISGFKQTLDPMSI